MKKTRRRFRKRGRAPVETKAPAGKPPAAGAAPAQPLQDVDIKAIEAKVMGQLTPENRSNVERIVVAGMKAALKGGETSIIASVVNSKDPVRDCAIGAVNLTMMMRKQSRDTMPVEAMVPGAMVLMLHALDFADRAKVIEIDTPQITRATKIFTNHLFNMSGITPDKLNTIGKKVTGITQDPAQMEELARRSGVVKDPRASTMTTLPEGLINGGGNVR